VPHTGEEGTCARITRRRKKRPVAEGEVRPLTKSSMPLDDEEDEDEEDKEMLLLNLMYAPIDTPLFSVARQLSRIEDLSHVLAWTPVFNDEAVVLPSPEEIAARDAARKVCLVLQNTNLLGSLLTW
jgi:hypothetical protein